MIKMIRHEGASIVFNSDEVQAVVITGQGRFSLLVKNNANPIIFASINDFHYYDSSDEAIITSIMLTMQKFISSVNEPVLHLKMGFEESFKELYRPWLLEESNKKTDEDLKEQWKEHKELVDSVKEKIIEN